MDYSSDDIWNVCVVISDEKQSVWSGCADFSLGKFQEISCLTGRDSILGVFQQSLNFQANLKLHFSPPNGY